MPRYAVTGIWSITETRYVTAKSEKEAIEKVKNGDYDSIDEDLQFQEFLGIEQIEKVK